MITDTVEVDLPFLGPRRVWHGGHGWTIEGKTPPSEGWFRFRLGPRTGATWIGPGEHDDAALSPRRAVEGTRVGNWIVPIYASPGLNFGMAWQTATPVRLIPDHVPRFCRIRALPCPGDRTWIFSHCVPTDGSEEQAMMDWALGAVGVDWMAQVGLQLALKLSSDQRRESGWRRRHVESSRTGPPPTHVELEGFCRVALRGSKILGIEMDPGGDEAEVEFQVGLRSHSTRIDTRTRNVLDPGGVVFPTGTNFDGAPMALEGLVPWISESTRLDRLVILPLVPVEERA